MRFVTYADGTGSRVGMIRDGEIVDVGFGGDMVAFIEADAPIGPLRSVGRPALLAPLRPRTLRDFLAFEGHLRNAFKNLGKEIPDEWYRVPAYYKGLPDTVVGPDAEVPWPSYAGEIDYELEIAVVIGRAGSNIAPASAVDHIFGYTIWNDLSARDTQRQELPIGMGPAKAKDWDGSNVLGPCIATPDEVDTDDIRASVALNGTVIGSDTTANMHHSFGDLIAYASLDLTLRAGEVIGSGTFANGAGIEQARYLQPGDTVEMTAVGIGTLRNRIGQPQRKENQWLLS
jgi:2-keto-4-pentenoate hydratase/2-oxohepta-3-ene-1,7-dioic acid hydratase in catechol pathway